MNTFLHLEFNVGGNLYYNIKDKNAHKSHYFNIEVVTGFAVLPRQSNVSATHSRSVRHGNKMNKRGFVQSYQQAMSPTKISRKMRRMNFEETHSHQHFGETVIQGKPPKVVVTESRPTIPNCANNANIFEQTYTRTHEIHFNVMNEIKTRSKVISFATDFDHIEIV